MMASNRGGRGGPGAAAPSRNERQANVGIMAQSVGKTGTAPLQRPDDDAGRRLPGRSDRRRGGWRLLRSGCLLALLVLGTLLALGGGAQEPAQMATEGPRALVLNWTGPIGPATAEYIGAGIERAVSTRARVLVLHLDTPGGLVTTTREIIRDILASPVPVIGFVGPRGAHAASAGTFIMYATHLAAMAPGTNLGAATPVQMGGGGLPLPGGGSGDGKEGEDQKSESGAGSAPEDAHGAKAVSDLAAYIRSLAELRGRNAEWAEQAVRQAASLTASEALEKGVIELIASDIPDLLNQADGRTVTLNGESRTLETDGLAIETFEPSWRIRLLSAITDPNIAFILMMIGVYGLIFEMANPGAVVPGVLGGICLLVGLYALSVLPLNYAGLGLILLGMGFMIAEAFLPSFGMLGIGGAVAFFIGATMLIDADAPGFALSWPVIIGTTACTGGVMLLVMTLAVRSQRRLVSTGRESMIGACGAVRSWSGNSGWVHIAGEEWRAEGPSLLATGQPVRVIDMRGLTLRVEPAKK